MIRLHRHILVSLAGMIGMLLCGACHSTQRAPQTNKEISLERMQGFPKGDTCLLKGVSALYAGTIGDWLVMGGGCNFPHIPAADQGKKVYYDGIYAAKLSEDDSLTWNKVGLLPEASAYGLSVTVPEGIICVGGTSESAGLKRVIRISMEQGSVELDSLPSLPVALDNFTGAVLDRTLYTVGGNAEGVPTDAVYALQLDAIENGWKRLADFPGGARVQAVCAASKGKLFVWGGFLPKVQDQLPKVYTNGYAYNPLLGEWTEVASPKDSSGVEISLGGGVATTLTDGNILCAGGVHKDIFLKALQGVYSGKSYLSHPAEWYQFNKKVLVYRIESNEWYCALQNSHTARAGAAIVSHGEVHYLLQGERKPGIRSNEINRLK